jgi:hypothetical protein
MPTRNYKKVKDLKRIHYRPTYCARSPGMPVQISVNVTPAVFQRIEALAKRHDCTRAALLAKVIECGLEKAVHP